MFPITVYLPKQVLENSLWLSDFDFCVARVWVTLFFFFFFFYILGATCLWADLKNGGSLESFFLGANFETKLEKDCVARQIVQHGILLVIELPNLI
jgi:hypothetical protein